MRFCSGEWAKGKVLERYLVWDEPLCISFPSLFALAVFKYAWVKDVWCSNEGGGSWYRLMTGSWMRFVDFFWPYTGREFSKQWMIG